MIRCSQCGRELEGDVKVSPLASISGSVMGDEYTESFFFCPSCEVYTVEIIHDRFAGDQSVSFRGPVAKSEGDVQIEAIKQCSEPWNKTCRCQGHRQYFGDSLD